MYGNKVYVQIPSNSCCNAGCYQTRHLCYQTRHNIRFKPLKSWCVIENGSVQCCRHQNTSPECSRPPSNTIIDFIVKMSCLVTSHLMKIKFKKQNEVSHWLNIITMIVTIDFRLFSEPKSKKNQNVLFDNCCSRNYRMLHWLGS